MCLYAQAGAKDFILLIAVWDSPRTLLLPAPGCLMKGGLHYGFRSTRSEEVYPGAQQTGHRRRAQAERLGGCQDVSVDGKGKTELSVLHSHTVLPITIYYVRDIIFIEASLPFIRRPEVRRERSNALVKGTSAEQMLAVNPGLLSKLAGPPLLLYNITHNLFQNGDISIVILSFAVACPTLLGVYCYNFLKGVAK